MAKNKNKPTSTETPANPSATPEVSGPPTTAEAHNKAVNHAEKAFLKAVEAGQEGTDERAALLDAKAARKEFMANRLPLCAQSYLDAVAGGDETTIQAAITELRSALSGIAKPAVVKPAAPAV